MIDYFAITILILEIMLLVIISLFLYRNIFNPLATFACYNVGLFTVGSYFNMIISRLDYIEYPISALNNAVWISIIWLASFAIAFIPIPKWIYHKYSLPADNPQHNKKDYIPFYIIFSLLTLLSFVALCLFSDTLKWLTNPREAYLYYRVGVGQFYVGYIWGALMLFSAILYFQRPKFWGLVLIFSIFFGVLYFSGKKSIIMALFIISLFYYHFYIKNFNLFSASIMVLITGSSLLYLIAFQAKQSFLSAFSYFDYIDTTARFLNRFDEFGFYLGEAFITSFWVLIPRTFFPDKPFEYGASLIHKVLYPGVAETGHTSGYLIWSEYYLDFGILGVIIYGLSLGIFKRYIFHKFLLNKNNFFLFCLCIHFSFKETWVFLPTFVVLFFIYLSYKLTKVRFF